MKTRAVFRNRAGSFHSNDKENRPTQFHPLMYLGGNHHNHNGG